MGSGELCDGGTITEGRGGTVVRSAGEGMAPCILLHGFAQTPVSWDAVAQRLQAAGHRAYAPDLYECKGDLKLPSVEEVLEGAEAGEDGEDGEDGEGAEGDANAKNVSGAVRDPLTSLDAACDRVAAIVRLVAQVDAAPVLVGYSMGGRIAAETVVRYPNLPLAGLVLESAGLGPADEAARAALAERNGAWAQRLRDEGVAAFMDWWETLPLFASQQALPAEARAAIRAERTSRDAEPLTRSLEAWGAHHQAAEAVTLGVLADLANRGVPVLYVAGVLDEKYSAVAARVRAAGLPTELVPDAGHNAHLEASSNFAGIVEGVLAEDVLDGDALARNVASKSRKIGYGA